jgi:hypothetical protein
MISERQEMENDIKKLEKDIELGVCLNNLKNNKDFKKLILNGFLQDYVLDILYKGLEIDYIKLESAKTLNDYFDTIANSALRAESNKSEYVKELNTI